MFDQAEMGGPAANDGAAPVPPATHEDSTVNDHCDAAPSAARDTTASAPGEATPSVPLWREAMPGPEMIAALAQVSLQACTDEQLLDVLAGWQRVEAWVAAQQTRALMRTQARLLETAVREESDLDGHTPWNAVYRRVETEISTALRWTSRMTSIRLDTAQQLTERLPNALDALAAGQLTYRHADMICDETVTLTDSQARRVVDQLLPEASSTTVGGLRRRIRKACLKVDPETANERAARATAERSVTIRPLPDGQAQLRAVGPADAILGMFRVLDETGDEHSKDDSRTQTARRFDALVDFVLTGYGSGTSTNPGTGTGTNPGSGPPPGTGMSTGCRPPRKIPVLVQITMDFQTLLGLRNNPAELHGYGPFPANLARTLAADGYWQRFLQDPVTGAPTDLGRTRRHPDTRLRRWIIARDVTCLFPHCYRPAKDCEPDHNPAWEHHGHTNKDTLTQLCPKHHKCRHHGWTYQRHPDRITWTSPHQQIYERYFTEADLTDPSLTDTTVSETTVTEPADSHPASSSDNRPASDEEFDDTIWPPTDEDQRIDIFLNGTRPGHRPDPDEDIPEDVVEAFRLEDPNSPWVSDRNYDPNDELILTPEEVEALLDEEHFRRYGSTEPPPPDAGKKLLRKARSKHHTWPDEPPF